MQQRVRPEERFGQALQQADERIAPQQMSAFVDQNVAELVVVQRSEQPIRQEDARM